MSTVEFKTPCRYMHEFSRKIADGLFRTKNSTGFLSKKASILPISNHTLVKVVFLKKNGYRLSIIKSTEIHSTVLFGIENNV